MVMTRLLGLVLLLGELFSGEVSAQIISGQRSGGVSIGTGTEVPATCTPGTSNPLFLDTDDEILYVCTATDTFTASNGSSPTLDQAFDGGKVIDGANSLANAVQIGDGVTPVCILTDATKGPWVRPCTDSNISTYILTNFTYSWFDVEGDAAMLTVDPDAASKNAMYQFGANYYPEKVARVALSPRGAVTIAEESIVTDQPVSWYATITDANTDAVDFVLTVTADMSHVTTATVKLYGVSKNAAPSGNIEFDCAIKSFRPGTDTFTAHSTTGEQAVLLTPSTQNRPVATTSAAITINGTVATGAMLYGSCEVDATATTSAQLTDFRLLGYADVRFTSNSLSN